MIKINWKPYDFKIVDQSDQRHIYDIIRKKYVVLTPEEWVRQNLVRYFIEEMKYPKSLIAIEKKLVFNQLNKRFDIVIYDRDIKPWMLIECKEPNVPINEITLSQSLVYHSQLNCKYIVLCNGKSTYCAAIVDEQLSWCTALPTLD